MASQCKRQQCTIDRRGFRQELDSWRHKLIHCVGFESILEGLFGRELVEDLKLFKDLEPTAVSDWSFDENCVFCCLRRNKVKEHLIGLSEEGPEDTPLDKDQARISRLEKQAEEFLNAVLCRKDVPNFSDPHIPVVAREILQRMIRQFAAEYTSKASPSQDSSSDSQPHSDQSLSTPPLPSGAPPSTSPATTVAAPAHNQNPVLSKLLMADQDAPLDLTIKKPLAVPCVQDGVLDLSIKKNRCSSGGSSQPVRSPYLCPAPSSLKGESPYFDVAKAKELQSTSTLEQFMAKLCPHHQRQIVDAIGFLQTEVKAFTASSALQDSKSTSGIQGNACSTIKSCAVTPEKADLKFPSKSKPVSEAKDVSHSILNSCAKVPENAVSLKTSVTADPALDLRNLGSESSQASVNPAANPADTDNSRHGDHAPLKMKIMTSNIADRKKLSCVLNAAFSSHSDVSEDRDGNSNSSIRTETHSARLNSPVKRPGPAGHAQQARHRETHAHTKDAPAKLFSVRMSIPPGTARKTLRVSSDHRIRDPAVRGLVDPDLGHCDIVFIDKPITECFKPQQRSMLPRRNARKSTRGHMYSDEIWELKTVRTLAGRGNCPNPMPELITSVTPKQVLSKPEGVPPVYMPFSGTHRELISQQMSTEESDESVIPGTGDAVEVAASDGDVIVETSQTDQSQSKSQSVPPSPTRYPTENGETSMNTEVEEEIADSGRTTEIEEIVPEPPIEAEKEMESEPQLVTRESTEQVVAETLVEPSKTVATEEAEATQPSSDTQLSSDTVPQANGAPSPVNQAEEEREDDTREEIQEEQPQEVQPEIQTQSDDTAVTEEESKITAPVEVLEVVAKEPETKTTETAESLESPEAEDDEDYDVSSKTMDALLKELPPWRRKRGMEISLPKRLRQKETIIVGYFNGRPISASDRSLRRRSSTSNTSLSRSPVRANQNMANTTSPSTDSAVSPNVENRNQDTSPSKTHQDKSPSKTNPDKSPSKTQQDKSPPGTHTPAGSIDSAPLVQPMEVDSAPVVQPVEVDSAPVVQPVEVDSAPVVQPVEVDRAPVVEPVEESLAASSRTRSKIPARTKPLQKRKTFQSDQDDQPGDRPQSSEPKRQLRSAGPTPAEPPASTPASPPAPPPASPHPPPPSITPPKSTVELNGDESQPEETNSQQIQKDESASPATQKLRSAKTVVDEKMQPNGDLTEQSPAKTEAQTPLRSKRNLRKDAEVGDASQQKPSVGDDCSSPVSDKPTRMPLRRESARLEPPHQSVTRSPTTDQKRLSLRSQKSLVPAASVAAVAGRQSDVASPTRVMPERVNKAQVKSPPLSAASVAPCSSATSIFTPSPEPPKQTNRFLETLTGEENQHLISNLNIKFDKMQKGWVQMDKEGQPTTKYKNRADRQAAIWKSRRRAKKAKCLEHQKYSPVQMLFMKGFNLSSICRWFLESTETKSLVIVKKVNTRLPSETQLCFHSSSSSGTSQGVFPSLQAERLKKHLKKFAIASPVKSNPKSQKMIAKALEQEANAAKGKEKRELPGSAQSHSSQAPVQILEAQKSSAKSKNPASARILRKYSNIREKMQVQQTNVRLKEASKTLRTKCLKRLATSTKSAKSKLKPSLKAQKSALPVRKQMKESAAKMGKRKAMAGKKPTKHRVQVRAVKAQSSSKASKEANKKELPKRYSQRLGSPKTPEHKPVEASKSKVETKKQLEAEKVEVGKPTVSKMNAAKTQAKESSQGAVVDVKGVNSAAVAPLQTTDTPSSADQVLTRSQRKMEAGSPESTSSPSLASKRLAKSAKTPSASPKTVRKAEEATPTRRAAVKSPAKRSVAASSPRGATKSVKRAQELLDTPAKRTRTSLSK